MPQLLATLLTWFGAATALLISGGIVNLLIQHLYLEPRREKAAAEARRKERAARLRLFALEAVELQERLVQYVRQVFERQISSSSPFELTTPEQVNELIKLGASDEAIQAIYFTKELANDVRRNVHSAQDQAGRPVPEGAFCPDPQGQFNCAAGFIRDRWNRFYSAVNTLLQAAQDDGCPVEGLRKNFQIHSAAYDKFRPDLEGTRSKPAAEKGSADPAK